MATHGWTGWRRFIFGSVAEKVVRLSTIWFSQIPNPEISIYTLQLFYLYTSTESMLFAYPVQ
jgi:hypothetical protein